MMKTEEKHETLKYLCPLVVLTIYTFEGSLHKQTIEGNVLKLRYIPVQI